MIGLSPCCVLSANVLSNVHPCRGEDVLPRLHSELASAVSFQGIKKARLSDGRDQVNRSVKLP